MSLKYRTSAGTSASNFTDLVVKVGDTLPIGSEIEYDGETVPAGWEEVDETKFGDVVVDSIRTKNLFDKNTAIQGYDLTSVSGEIKERENWLVSNYIEVKPNTNYTLSGKTSGTAYCFYNADKTFNRAITGPSDNGTITVPNDNSIKYMRMNTSLTSLSTLQIEEGSTATTYKEGQDLHIGLATQMSNGLMSFSDKTKLDNIITRGTNSNGEYLRFEDGTQICIKQVDFPNVTMQPWGSLYEVTGLNLGDYAIAFKYTPFMFSQLYGNDGYIEAIKGSTNSSFGTINIGCPTNGTGRSYQVGLFAIGRWK